MDKVIFIIGTYSVPVGDPTFICTALGRLFAHDLNKLTASV